MVFKFTIDNIFNRYVPHNRVHRAPRHIRRFLGSHNPPPVADYWIWLEILVSSFCGIALLEGVFKSHTVFSAHHTPMIVASFGATAILCFNAHHAPLSQPRNIIMGHFVSTLIGICIQKLFLLSAAGRNNYWASGALSVAAASTAMSILNCVHPPGGASAIIPSIDAQVQEMSWWFLPVVLIMSILITCVALITGNVIRKYPSFWWTPVSLSPDLEDDLEKIPPEPKRPRFVSDVHYVDKIDYVKITANGIVLPTRLDIEEIDMEWLELVRQLIASTDESSSEEKD